jgi:hypothetical protein
MNLDFKLAKYEFHLAPGEDIRLPRYPGSTLRGGFGRAFRNVVCASRERECSECLLKGNCIFPRVFDTAPPAGWERMPGQSKAPRPFVIEPPMDGKPVYEPGETIAFGLILVGYATEYLPYFIYSFEELGRKFGLGRGRGKFRLAEVRSVSLTGDRPIYSQEGKLLDGSGHVIGMEAICEYLRGFPSDRIVLNFVTPTRITRLGELIAGGGFQFEHLIRAVFRRGSMLASLFCNSEWDLDYSSLLEKAGEVRADAIGHAMRRWERYSRRQDKRLTMSGFTGRVRLEGNLEEFLPFIKLGELIHVGKGTTFGMGKYVIQN